MPHPWSDELTRCVSGGTNSRRNLYQAVQAAITPEVLDKKDNSPVTVADFASQAVICHAIGEAFAADPVIAEEDSLALHQEENDGFLRRSMH